MNNVITCFFIRSWNRHFETPESLKRTRAGSWVPMPNKHDGRGYRRIMSEDDGRNIYGTWTALVQTASKMSARGILADHDGPISAEDLATKIMATTKEVTRAIEVTMNPKIGWLGTVDWDLSSSFDDNVKRISEDHDNLGARNPPVERLPPAKRSPRSSNTLPNRRQILREKFTCDGNPSRVNGTQHACGENRLHDITIVHDITNPSAVSQGRQSAEADPVDSEPELPTSSDNLIRNPEIAKRLICEKILGGKNPGRMWSPDAENRLAMMCEEGLPFQEILDIGEYRAIPKSDDIPELKKRIDPITETTLMLYWADEDTRAKAYLKKYRRKSRGDAAKKDEPPRWREYFRWQYDDDCVLPDRFDQLADVQKSEYQRDFETFEKAERPSGNADSERLVEPEPARVGHELDREKIRAAA